MAEKDVDRILDKLEKLDKDLAEIRERFAVHCAQDEQTRKNGGWKTYLLFMVAGAMLSQGPALLPILMKFVGIAG